MKVEIEERYQRNFYASISKTSLVLLEQISSDKYLIQIRKAINYSNKLTKSFPNQRCGKNE
jgi:hypothetical protein